MEAPKQPRLPFEEMQRTTVDVITAVDGSLKQGQIISLQAVVEMIPDKLALCTAHKKIVILPMRWQQDKVVELDNKQNKQFDPVE